MTSKKNCSHPTTRKLFCLVVTQKKKMPQSGVGSMQWISFLIGHFFWKGSFFIRLFIIVFFLLLFIYIFEGSWKCGITLFLWCKGRGSLIYLLTHHQWSIPWFFMKDKAMSKFYWIIYFKFHYTSKIFWSAFLVNFLLACSASWLFKFLSPHPVEENVWKCYHL